MAKSPVIGWVIEPKDGKPPYMTLKPEVADKRRNAGDFVQAIKSIKQQPDDEEM